MLGNVGKAISDTISGKTKYYPTLLDAIVYYEVQGYTVNRGDPPFSATLHSQGFLGDYVVHLTTTDDGGVEAKGNFDDANKRFEKKAGCSLPERWLKEQPQ